MSRTKVPKLYWRIRKASGRWTYKPATLTPRGKPVPYRLEEEEE